MNDRTSKRPPSLYTKGDDTIEHFSTQTRQSHLAPNRHTSLDGIGTYYDAGIDSSRSSGIDRFRRAIVSVFNPITSWAGLGNNREKKEPLPDGEKRVLQARRVRAEKEYAELKKNGFRGTHGSLTENQNLQPTVAQHHVEGTQPTSHRDSGIDMESRSSSERKQNGPLSTLVPPPSMPTSGRRTSPFTEQRSAGKPSGYFRKQSFKSLKTVKSHIQLPSAKRSTPPTVESFELEKPKILKTSNQNLRKQPSRKDIAKQQRLSKRVSDLESQLEVARINLKLSLSEDVLESDPSLKARSKPFVPGALPSLLSEGVLKTHVARPNDQNSAEPQSKQSHATFSERQSLKQSTIDNKDYAIPDIAAQLGHELQVSAARQCGSLKRRAEAEAKGEKGISHEVNNRADDVELDAANKPRLRRSSRQSLKTQRIKDAEVSKKPQQTPVPRTPRNSPNKHTEPVPPLPNMLASFHTTKVDQAKLVAMRSSHSQNTPFGKDPEDLKNLRKEFPTIDEALLSEYLGALPDDKKVTDHTSLSHHNQPITPVLGPPRSASPIKAKSLNASDHNSSIPISKFSSQLPPQVKEEEEVNESNTNQVSGPLKEEYEWPEDVF